VFSDLICSQRLSLAPARQLKFSPAWPCSDARIVFDCVSGDYWVLTQLGAFVLGQVSTSPDFLADQIRQQVTASLRDDTFAVTFEQTLQQLSDAGLVQGVAPLSGLANTTDQPVS